MPTVECGFPNARAQGLTPAQALTRIGPTIWVIIGAYPGSALAQPSASASIIEQLPALVDTGANLSGIDDGLAQQLQLPIVDQWQISGISGPTIMNVYLGQITIPSLAAVQFGRFAGVHLAAGGSPHKALIGRSLLEGCTLAYNGKTGSVLVTR